MHDPTQDGLQSVMQAAEQQGVGNLNPSPDRRLDAKEGDLELVDGRFFPLARHQIIVIPSAADSVLICVRIENL